MGQRDARRRPALPLLETNNRFSDALKTLGAAPLTRLADSSLPAAKFAAAHRPPAPRPQYLLSSPANNIHRWGPIAGADPGCRLFPHRPRSANRRSPRDIARPKT